MKSDLEILESKMIERMKKSESKMIEHIERQRNETRADKLLAKTDMQLMFLVASLISIPSTVPGLLRLLRSKPVCLLT